MYFHGILPKLTVTHRFVIDCVLVLLFPLVARVAFAAHELPWKIAQTLDYACGYSCTLLVSLLLSALSVRVVAHAWSGNRKMMLLFIVSGVVLGGAWCFSICRPSELQEGNVRVGLKHGQFVVRVSTTPMQFTRYRHRTTIGPRTIAGAPRSVVGLSDFLSLPCDRLGLVHARVTHDKGSLWFSIFMPVWVLLLGSWTSMIIVVLRWNEKRRKRDKLCQVCNYDLTRNSSGTCPECGTSIPEEQRKAMMSAAAKAEEAKGEGSESSALEEHR